MKNLRNRAFQASKWHTANRLTEIESKTINFQARFITNFLLHFFRPQVFPTVLALIQRPRRYVKPTRYNCATCATLTPCLLVLWLVFGISTVCVRGEVTAGTIWTNRDENGISVVILIKGLTFYCYFDQNPNFISGVIHYSSCQIWNRNTRRHW